MKKLKEMNFKEKQMTDKKKGLRLRGLEPLTLRLPLKTNTTVPLAAGC